MSFFFVQLPMAYLDVSIFTTDLIMSISFVKFLILRLDHSFNHNSMAVKSNSYIGLNEA